MQTNVPLIHQVVTAQLAAARQGTHKTKGRGEVSGSGTKPFKQKGTGRARQGSIRMPQHRGGGIVHGPVPRDYSERTPKKMIAAALLGVLSDRARGERLHVIDSFGLDSAPSTKTAIELLAAVATSKHVLIVLDRDDEVSFKSVRNLHQRARAVRRPAERLRRGRQRRHRLHEVRFRFVCCREDRQRRHQGQD